MIARETIPRYGVRVQTTVSDALSAAAEELRLLGYAVVDGGYSPEQVRELQEDFDKARRALGNKHGWDELRSIDEHNTIRCPLSLERSFLDLAVNDRILSLCADLIGPGFILNQQNGIVNPADEPTYNQAFWHRDLPYQHFVSSRPIAINALYCVDDFTLANGATLVIPATHKHEAFPSDHFVSKHAVQVTAPAGSFLVLDCMLYHCGGKNSSGQDRRAVNHLYTIGALHQQIELPSLLGPDFSADPTLKRLLGYEYSAWRSHAEYYESRARKLQTGKDGKG